MVHFVLMGTTYFLLFNCLSPEKKNGKRIKGWDKMSKSHLFWCKNIQKLQKKVASEMILSWMLSQTNSIQINCSSFAKCSWKKQHC